MFLDTIIHFDIAALFIFAITIFYVVYRKSYKAKSSFIFLLINISYFVVCLLDIFVSTDILPVGLQKTFMFLYYYLKYQTSLVFLLYIVIITNSEDLLKSKKNKIIFSIPFIITVGYLISNIFTGQIYYYENDVYHRGDLIFLFYGLSFVYVIVGIIWIIRFAKTFSLPEIVALASVYILSIAALLIQFFNGDVLIEILSSAISFLLLNITLERSQLIVDSKTGLKNKKIFDRLIYSCFKRKRKYGLVLLYIKNYKVIYDRFNYDIAVKNIRKMVNHLSTAFISDFSYTCYYLDIGTIAILTSDYEDAKKLASKLDVILTNYDTENIVFNPDYILYVADVPFDFKNRVEFNYFISNCSEISSKDESIINIKEFRNDKKSSSVFELEEILSNAIDKKQIFVEFQPLYEIGRKKFSALEALARIADPKYGLLNAESFINYAERKDYIYDIDLIVIDNVYRQFYERKLDYYGIKSIYINLSIKTLLNSNFITDLETIEKKYNIPKDLIVFEIKEREKDTYNVNAYNKIREMMEDGFRFSLDNFGIGCMPIENLVSVPFVNVKFNRVFAKEIENNNTSVVLENTIKLFKKVNKMSVCSGIETEEEAKKLENLNPDFMQGFYYSKPLPLDKLIVFLNEHNLT